MQQRGGSEDVAAGVVFVGAGFLLADVCYDGGGVRASLDVGVDGVYAVVREVEDGAVDGRHVADVLQDVGPEFVSPAWR